MNNMLSSHGGMFPDPKLSHEHVESTDAHANLSHEHLVNQFSNYPIIEYFSSFSKWAVIIVM